MIPLGQCCEAETASSHYFFHCGPSHLFINLLFRPPAPLTAHTFVSYSVTYATLRMLQATFASHLFTTGRLLKHPPLSILYQDSLILALQLLLCSPTKRLHQTNSIIKVKSELEL